jgi:hypothetical protein
MSCENVLAWKSTRLGNILTTEKHVRCVWEIIQAAV